MLNLFNLFQANIINRFGGVKMEDIRGLRVPYLKPGWNRQFLMMKEFGFVYDSSIPAPLSDPPLWPYTLDYKIPHKCIGRRKCPSRSFPGIWVRDHPCIMSYYFVFNSALFFGKLLVCECAHTIAHVPVGRTVCEVHA